jgi:3-oxoacyl-[acyl-carrier-protein] synthase-3
MLNRSVIRSIAHYVPPKVVTNHDFEKVMETSDAWITERTGIRERRWAEDGVTTSEIGLYAAKEALARAGRDAKDIDLIVAATLSPDMYFPGIGVQLQQKLGCRFIPGLDIRAQCSGFIYGLSTADAFIRSGQAKRVLLVCSEIQHSVLDLTTKGRDMAVLFGDGAGALVIEAEEATADSFPSARNMTRGVIDSILGSDGSGAEILALKKPGVGGKEFVSRADFDAGAFHPNMDGKTVFKNAVTRLCEVAAAMCKKHGVRPQDIDLVAPHQANLRINEMVREQLGIAPERVFNNIHKYGNTTAATIPIVLSEAQAEGKLKEGSLVLTLAFGSGFTWGANLVRW